MERPSAAGLLAIQTRRAGSRKGRGRMRRVLTTLKMVELAPMPRPTMRMAKVAKPMSRRKVRRAYFKSRENVSSQRVALKPLADWSSGVALVTGPPKGSRVETMRAQKCHAGEVKRLARSGWDRNQSPEKDIARKKRGRPRRTP